MMSLFALAPLRPPGGDPWLLKLWGSLGVYGRIGVVLAAIIALAIGVFWTLRWLSRRLGARLWRILLRGFTGLCFVGFAGLGLWSHFLRDGLWFATRWYGYGPYGYTSDMARQVFG